MQLLSLGSMLAGLPDASGSWHFPSVLGSVPPLPVNGAYIGYQIVNLILGILAMWLAAKAVVPKETATFGNVLKAWVCNFALGIGIVVVGVVLLMFAMKMHDAMRSWLMLIGFGGMVLGLVLLIPMKVYSIEAPRAFGLLLLTFCIHFAILFIGLLAVVSFVGRDRVMAVVGQQQFMAMVQSRIAQVQHAQPGQPVQPLSLNMFGNSAPPPPPDYAAEIDGLLNAALHPAGPKPSLEERENVVRNLQQKLRSEKDSLIPGDGRAALVYQNQLNRYLLLLDQVKSERKVQMLTMPAPAQRDATFARPIDSTVATRPH